MWFSVYLQRVLQSDIHVASYSYDAENEEWCEVSLQVILAVLSINVYISRIWLVFLWGRPMSCWHTVTGRCLRQETLWLLASETKEKRKTLSVAFDLSTTDPHTATLTLLKTVISNGRFL